MSEKGILFNGPMVRAILEGRKTQTRRVVKPKRKGGVIAGPAAESGCAIEAFGGGAWHKPSRQEVLRAPYSVGDLLYVRETWRWTRAHWGGNGNMTHIGYRADGADIWRCKTVDELGTDKRGDWKRWRPSIHMPKWAARLWLEVTAVRCERLGDISGWDVLAEGIDGEGPEDLHMRFRDLWDSIHQLEPARGKDGCTFKDDRGRTIVEAKHTWEANPWVWVYEFRRVER